MSLLTKRVSTNRRIEKICVLAALCGVLLASAREAAACASELVITPTGSYIEILGDPSLDPVDEMWIFPVTEGVTIDFDDVCGFPIFSSTGPWLPQPVFATPIGDSRPQGGVEFVLGGGGPFIDGTYIRLPLLGFVPGETVTLEVYCHDPNAGYDGPHLTAGIECDLGLPPPLGCPDQAYMSDVAAAFQANVCGAPVPAVSRWGLGLLSALLAITGIVSLWRR